MSALERFAAATLFVIAITIFGVLGTRWYGAKQFAAGHAAAVDERARADAAAVLKRSAENVAAGRRQDETNSTITKDKDDEIADLRKRLASAGRLRVGPAICPDRPSAASEAQSPAGGDSADPSVGLVSERADADLKQLIEQVEIDLATGRACQAFVRENGLVP